MKIGYVDFRHRIVMDAGDHSKIIYGMRASEAPSSDWRTLPSPFAGLSVGGKRPVPGGEMRERPTAFFNARIV